MRRTRGPTEALHFFCYLGFNLLYVSVAILCVYIEPVSAGSGIPEVKCYLNGINVPRIVRVRTLFCKAFGVLFSVAAAFAGGQGGPHDPLWERDRCFTGAGY